MDKIDFEKQERGLNARARKVRSKTSSPGNGTGIVSSVESIYSDGVRMSATVWRPDDVPSNSNSTAKFPAILLCHGWGGKRAHLDFSYAKKFAEGGFVALTFDYRGWGDSDGVLVRASSSSSSSSGAKGKLIEAREVRKIIDPEWQLRDIDAALNYLMGLDFVDTNRVGIWGSSFGGGHSLAVGARDLRVKCIVCQIGSIDTHANWINRHPEYRGEQQIRKLATLQAQGKVFPWNLKMPKGLDGAPNLPKVVFEHTRNTIGAVSKIRVPTLILAAENEELFKNERNSLLVYEILRTNAPSDIAYLPGGHYDAYGQPAYGIGSKKALEWFQLYLGSPKAKL